MGIILHTTTIKARLFPGDNIGLDALSVIALGASQGKTRFWWRTLPPKISLAPGRCRRDTHFVI
jgi:hypothetical protein